MRKIYVILWLLCPIEIIDKTIAILKYYKTQKEYNKIKSIKG